MTRNDDVGVEELTLNKIVCEVEKEGYIIACCYFLLHLIHSSVRM